jgi:hypothetical protein
LEVAFDKLIAFRLGRKTAWSDKQTARNHFILSRVDNITGTKRIRWSGINQQQATKQYLSRAEGATRVKDMAAANDIDGREGTECTCT